MGTGTDRSKLIGIKGWLLLPATLLVLSFLISSLDIKHYLYFLKLFTFQFAGVGKIILFDAIVKLLLFLHYLVTIIVVWLFFRKNKSLPKAYIIYLWLSFFFSLIMFIGWDIIHSDEIVVSVILRQVIAVGISLAASLLGTLYFARSRRVKNTFTNPFFRGDRIFAVVYPLAMILIILGSWIIGKNDSISNDTLEVAYKYPMLEIKFVEEDPDKIRQAADGNLPSGYDYLDLSSNPGDRVLLIKDAAMVFDSYLEEVDFKIDDNWPAVEIALDRKGAKEFAKLTGDHVGERLAVVFNGKVLYAPVVREQIAGGRLQISGDFSPDEMKQVARILNFVIQNKTVKNKQ